MSVKLREISSLLSVVALGVFLLGCDNNEKAASEKIKFPGASVRASCLNALPRHGVTTAQGEIRFMLLERTQNHLEGKSGVVLRVAPGQLHPGVPVCPPAQIRDGAVVVRGVSVSLPDGPRTVSAPQEVASKDGRFWLVISHSADNSLRERRDFALKQGTWIDRGRAFDLTRYQQIAGVKDGKPTPETSYLGANYVGESPSGKLVTINCVDFDPTKVIACQFWEQVEENVRFTILIPSENLGEWKRYSSIAEEFYQNGKVK
jgi:hypothetical protein